MHVREFRMLASRLKDKSTVQLNIMLSVHGRRNRWSGHHGLECGVFYNRFGAYCVPDSCRHRPAAQRIMAGQVWEQETLAFIREAYSGGDIVHAGTFFGDFLPALSRTAAGGKVWAFEPNPESYRCASITALLNGLDNVVLTCAALGEAMAVESFVTRDAEGRALGGASHVAMAGETSDAETRTVAIDAVVPADRRVGVIQLDVEGYEQQALAGALRTIARDRPAIILETPPHEWVSAHLAPLGYRAEGTVNHNTILRAAP